MIYRHTSTSLFSLFSRCVYYAVDRSDSLSIYAERRLFCPALAWTLEIENWWRGEAHTYAKQLTTLHLNVLVPRCKGGKKPFSISSHLLLLLLIPTFWRLFSTTLSTNNPHSVFEFFPLAFIIYTSFPKSCWAQITCIGFSFFSFSFLSKDSNVNAPVTLDFSSLNSLQNLTETLWGIAWSTALRFLA